VLLPRSISEPIERLRLLIVRPLLRVNLSQDIVFLFLASVAGIASGYGAVLFHEAIRLVHSLFFVHFLGEGSSWPLSRYLIALLPALGGLMVGLLGLLIGRDSRGHGVPDVIAAVIARGGYLKGSLAASTTVSAAVSIGSGGGAGREGPIVLIGAAVGSAIGQLFRLSSDHLRTLAAAGAAGGIAAIFNAPLGGVMFALEIIIGDFSVRKFSPIVVSAVLATAVSRSYLGDHPTFVPTDYALASNTELLFYLGLGLAAGVVSVGFIRVMFWTERLLEHLHRIPRWLQPAIGGLGVGVVLVWLPSIAGYTYAVNNQAILGQADAVVLLGILFLKPLVVGLTLGSGGSGGVFAPALKAGAAFGGLAGMGLHLLFPELTGSSGAYALVGMGALVAGTMHAPLTAILMIFEVSDTYEVILPIMFAAVSSAVVARLMLKHSIYTLPLERQGIEIGYGINISIVNRVTVEEIMQRAIVRIRRSTSIRDLVRLVEETDQSVFPVVTDAGAFLGVVRFQDLRTVLRSPDIHETLIAEDIMVKNVPRLSPRDALDMTLKTFELSDFDMLPVLDGSSLEVVGLVDHEDALRRYRKEILLHSAK